MPDDLTCMLNLRNKINKQQIRDRLIDAEDILKMGEGLWGWEKKVRGLSTNFLENSHRM